MLALGSRPSPLLTLETAVMTMSHGSETLLVEWLEANPHARLLIIDTFAKMRGSDPHGMPAYAAATRFKAIADH